METPVPQNRRLAAVMFLDMVGFSAMMSRDERRALEHVRELERIVKAEIPSHGGRLVKLMGDGTLAEFPTAVSAVLCAKAVLTSIQGPDARAKAPDLKVRIGLHLGELVEHDRDIFGDAVNIAARVQPLAAPDGIAMSDAVYAQVKNQMSLIGEFLPPQKLKNIPERQKIFVIGGGTSRPMRHARRLAPIAAGILALAAAGAGGIYFARSGAQTKEAPIRTGFVIVQTKDDDSESKDMALAIEQEIELAGPKLKGIAWMDHSGIWETLRSHGITDAMAVTRGEAGACHVSREMGLRFPMVGRLERLPGAGWRLETRATDTEDLSVIGAFTADGADPETLARETIRQYQKLIDERKEDFS